jgi:hypothetical protein
MPAYRIAHVERPNSIPICEDLIRGRTVDVGPVANGGVVTASDHADICLPPIVNRRRSRYLGSIKDRRVHRDHPGDGFFATIILSDVGGQRMRAHQITNEKCREAAIVAAENVSGVKRVHDHLCWVDAMFGMYLNSPEDDKLLRAS